MNAKQKRNRNNAVQTLKFFIFSVFSVVGIVLIIYGWFSFNWSSSYVLFQLKLPILIFLMLIEVVLLIFLIQTGYTLSWTGLGGDENEVTITSAPNGNYTAKVPQPSKSIWDWLTLLGVLAVPIVVAIATILFGIQQANLAMQQHDSDQQIANDQQQEVTLNTYLDDMSDLLLNHNLRNSKPGDEVRQIARTRTLTTLRRLVIAQAQYPCPTLNPYATLTPSTETPNFGPIYNICSQPIGLLKSNRNWTVLQFLRDEHLIGGKNAIVDLTDADLSGDYLTGVNLRNVDLSGADLSYADLQWADLRGATLCSNQGGQKVCADLSDTHLFAADLTSDDLRGSNITQKQLDDVSLCKNATLPTGLTCNNKP